MKLSPKEIKLLFKSTKRIKRKNFVGIIIVHESKKRDYDGKWSCIRYADVVKEKKLTTDNLCPWNIMIKCSEQSTQRR